MHNIINPQQTQLFDPFDSVLTVKTRTRLLSCWHGAFRHVILELMPVDAVSGHFDATMGRPTKELYSMADLLLMKEFKDWTKDEALDAYCLDMATHYALNLEPVTLAMIMFSLLKRYHLEHTAKERRLAGRRKEQATEVFRERYKVRGGIEGTNSGLKRKTGLSRLRVRGRLAVDHAIYLKIAGWNIMRASVCAKMRQIVWERAHRAVFAFDPELLRMIITVKSVRVAVRKRVLLHLRKFEKSPMLGKAA